jgi:Trp operon repressor
MNISEFLNLFNVKTLGKKLVATVTCLSFFLFTTGILQASEFLADMSEDAITSNFYSMDFMFEANTDAHFHRRVRSLLANNNHSAAMLHRMAIYMPLIEEELDQRDLPSQLKYLTITESSVNPVARSRAGAVGLWQIMLGTARHLGLRVNRLVDERRDPVAATKAALDYLEFLFEKYGDWKLALAAYNAGPGRVDQAVKRANSKDFDQVKRFLPLETRNYIPSFMASVYFGEFHKIHGLVREINDFDLVLTDVVRIYQQMTFKEIAEISGVDVKIIRQLNPMHLSSYIPSSRLGYNLILPRRGVAQMESKITYLDGVDKFVDHKRIFEEYIEAIYLVEEDMSWKEIADVLYLNPYQLAYLNPSVPASGPSSGDQIRYVIPRFAGFFVKAVEDEHFQFIRIESAKILNPVKLGSVRNCRDYDFCLAYWDTFEQSASLNKMNKGGINKINSEASRGQSQNDLNRLQRLTEKRNRIGTSAYAGE